MVFIETLKQKQTNALGGFSFSCICPRCWGIPPIAIIPDKVKIYPEKKRGVKGMLPLGCFPLWGREGVILQAAAENKRIEKKEDFNRAA
jgi:hypothetical protein